MENNIEELTDIKLKVEQAVMLTIEFLNRDIENYKDKFEIKLSKENNKYLYKILKKYKKSGSIIFPIFEEVLSQHKICVKYVKNKQYFLIYFNQIDIEKICLEIYNKTYDWQNKKYGGEK